MRRVTGGRASAKQASKMESWKGPVMTPGRSIDPAEVASRFAPGEKIVTVRPLGNGLINDTFRVLLDSGDTGCFVLQRINHQVFRDPQSVMLNMRTVCDHGRQRLADLSPRPKTRFELPRILPAEDGRSFWVDSWGNHWRAMSFIEGSISWDIVQNADHAYEVGTALGLFHTIMSDLPADELIDTLPGFHVTPGYLDRYDEVCSRSPGGESPGALHAHRFIAERRDCVRVLEEAREQGKLPLRTIHGDPKVGNVLIDASTRRAVSLVDLDTVKPGLIHYDIGDCLRSCCNPGGSDVEEGESVRFDPDLCRAALRGYLAWAGQSLTELEIEYFYDAVRLIALELGIRFFTDFLEGNVFFKTNRPDQNLSRALVQFRLTESIENQERQIRSIIRELR